MKYRALFYQKNDKKNIRLSSTAVAIGALRVKKELVITQKQHINTTYISNRQICNTCQQS